MVKEDGPKSSSPCHCAALRKASRRVTQLYDAALAPAGLTISQLSMLAEISRPRPTPLAMGELAQAMGMDRSTLGHNLRPLERDRLVKFVADKADRRSRQLRLTAAGAKRLQEARDLWKGAQARFEAAFGAKQATELRQVLLGLAELPFETAI